MRATLLVLAILAAGLFWLVRSCQVESAAPGPSTEASSPSSGHPPAAAVIFRARDARQWLDEEPGQCLQAAIRN